MPLRQTLIGFSWLLVVLVVWDLVWKALALWKAARHRQKIWFVFLLLINSVGILPIIYLQFFQKDRSASK